MDKNQLGHDDRHRFFAETEAMPRLGISHLALTLVAGGLPAHVVLGF